MLKRLLSVLAATTLFSQFTHADAMVWKVSNDQGELYLGGTLHMLRESDYPLNPEYTEAFNNSDVIVFETDIKAAMDMGFQQQLMMRMSLPPGKTLESSLQPATFARLQHFAETRNIPIDTMKTFKPAMAILMLSQIELQKIGVQNHSGIENYFSTLATNAKKPIASLETPDEQITTLASLGEGYEDDYVNGSLDDLENVEKEFTQLIKAWKNADLVAINTKMIQVMKDRLPEAYSNLLLKRNLNWLKHIEQMIKTPEKEFILVGAAHLVGDDSVQNLLRKQGYKVEKFNLKK